MIVLERRSCTVNFDACASSARSPAARIEPSSSGRYFWPPVEMSSTSGRTTVHSGWSPRPSFSHAAIRSRPVGRRGAAGRPRSRGSARKISARFICSSGRVDRDVRLVGVVQEGEHPVVLFLRERVVLVVVALGALDRQAEDALADGVHPVEHRLHAELLGVDAALLVDHRVAEEAGGDDLVLRRVRQQVAGDLLDDELVVRQVAVERVDDPVAVEPDLPRLVLLVAVGVGVAGRVEPDAGPSARRSAARRAAARPASRRRPGDVSARNASTSASVGGRPIRSRLSAAAAA